MCWKVQNLLVQIWTSITLDPVDRTQLNFQENFIIYNSNDLCNFIELFSKLTNLLAKQKGYQFNWENTIVSFLYWVGSNYITEIETETETETEIIY